MNEKSNCLTMVRLTAKLANFSALIFGLFFIALAIQSCKTSKSSMMPDGKKKGEFVIVEKMPAFPGGDEARMRFLQENIIYPAEARTKGYQGTVYVTFVVDPDGQITDVRVLKGVHESIDAEAVRVVSMMPNWEPGIVKDEPVRVQFTMPISFTLQGIEKK